MIEVFLIFDASDQEVLFHSLSRFRISGKLRFFYFFYRGFRAIGSESSHLSVTVP